MVMQHFDITFCSRLIRSHRPSGGPPRMKSNQRHYREIECHVATMWQLRGLRDNYGVYVGLAGRVSDTVL